MKTKLMFLGFALYAFTALGQKQAVVSFENTQAEFGKIKEENGKASVVFNFTNTGNDNLKIIEVKPSCSCITAEWPQTDVAPGQKGAVKVFYDPYHRSGEFNKSLLVHSNASVPEITLNIKGEVIPKVKTLVDSFPARNGNLMMANSAIFLRNTSNKEIKKDSLLIYNTWDQPMTLSFKNAPSFIDCKAKPTTIAPKKTGKICIAYDAAKKNDYGIVADTIILVTNDAVNPEKKVAITATITDDFSKLTPEQKKNAPVASFTTDYIDFGTCKSGEIVKKSYELTNKGVDTLFIRKAVPYKNDCKAYIEGKSALAAGQSTKITIEFNTNGLTGDEKRTILLNTNDPNKAFIILILKGKITQ